MTDSYIQNQLIEVNQSTSEESRSGNSQNPSEFTNTFSDTISFKPGDKISLQSSFIAERGSGNSKTIELKGSSLGIKKIKYTKETKKTLDYPSKKIVELVYDEVEEDIELFDNKTSMVLNYYKNMNGTGYVALPRKFIYNASDEISQLVNQAGNVDEINNPYPWGTVDSLDQGYLPPVPSATFMLYADHFIEKCSNLVKLKNDNSKYTVFVARASELFDEGYTQTTPVPSNSSQEPPNASWTIAPEYQDFYQYRELQTIEVPAGFSSADYVANEITRQLQQLQGTRDLIFRPRDIHGNYPEQSANLTSDTPISRVVDCATYKTFSCANEITMKDTQFNLLIDDPTAPSKWWQSYPTIAMKRPELYDTGKNINIEFRPGDPNGLWMDTPNTAGSNIKVAWTNASANDDYPLLLNIPYRKETLDILKKFIDSQTLYPEVYDSFDQDINEIYGMPTYSTYNQSDINSSNTRYFHMNQIANASQIELDPSPDGEPAFTAQEILDRTSLGSSNYRVSNASTNPADRLSKLLLVYHQEADKDTFYENPKADQYTYGCFRKVGTYPFDYIAVYPKRQSNPTLAMPTWFLDGGAVEVGRKFGYDTHWTAPTTCAINIYNGQRIYPNFYGRNANATLILPNYNASVGQIADGTGTTLYQTPLAGDISQNVPFPPSGPVGDGINTNPSYNGSYTQGDLFNLRYIGADSPKLAFDGEHFSFSQLHTAENLGSRSADGGRYADYITGIPALYLKGEVNTNANDVVYKINPFEDINEFCPALMPYRGQVHFFTANGGGSAGAGEQCINEYNTNYEQYQIYDSKSGIFFEDMGYTQDTWEDGLWGICGFSYNQFNGSANNRQLRVDGTNSKSLRYPTTNAEVVGTDTKTWVVNDNGIPLYSDNIPSPFAIAKYSTGGVLGKQSQIFPNITQKTISTNLVADNFPRSMLRGYYTIRSDIIADSLFVGGQSNITNMPIVGVVTKENPQNDFYFGVGDVEFTVGKPTRLSSIKVSIHNPDGSYAGVNKNSSVIFRVQRQMNVSFNIAEEILASEKGKKSKL